MKNLIKKLTALLIATGIAVSVSGCGIITTTKNIIEKDETQSQTQEAQSAPEEAYELATLVPALDILAEIPYIGNRSICKMDKAMALAYKDAIESMSERPSTGAYEGDTNSYSLKALLADPAGDGMPILITAYVYPEKYEYSYCEKDYGNFVEALFWEYRDGKAKKVEIARPETNGFGKIGNKTYYRNAEFFHDVGPNRTGLYYLIENATITLKHTIDIYAVVTNDSNGQGYGDLPEGATYGRTPGELSENGWKVNLYESGSATAFLCIHNGKNITDTCSQYDHDAIAQFTQTINFVHSDDANYHLEVRTDKGTNVAENLEKYSKSVGRPSYRYSQVAENLEKDKVNGIIKAVKGIIAGRIGEIYQLSEDLYYIIMYADDELSGGVLLKNTNGGKSWRPVSSQTEPLTETELDKVTEEDLKASNITIDTKAENAVEALKNAIANVDGSTVNDTAKNEIADYIAHCIAQAGKTTVKAKKNTVKITEKTLEKCIKPALEKKIELIEVVQDNSIVLNKAIPHNILVECDKIDADKEIKFILNGELGEINYEIDTLEIKAKGTPYSIKINGEALAQTIKTYRTLVIIIKKTDDGVYSLKFTDADGKVIENLGTPVTFTLPADNELCTVQLEYVGGTDNWGGQYDSNNSTLIFETPYSGAYTVLDNKTQISDIDGLDKEQKKAIEFMVSKGYMTLDGDKFNPTETLTRYQFTQALVGMFFALDREVKTTFTDVPADSEFYPYVASAQKDNIVEGFTDTEFAGDMDMTTEQMVALAGRTLVKYKGYVTPDNAQRYLDGFTDKDKISDWAYELVAISVREGLVDRTSEFGPHNPINREQAAEILYRLFLLLYEVEPETSAAAQAPDVMKITVVSICSAVAIICIVLIVILLKRRKNIGKKQI